MTASEWEAPWYHCFGLWLDAEVDEIDAGGEPLRDDRLLLVLNASDRAVDFRMPQGMWSLVVDTARPDAPEDTESYAAGQTYAVGSRSLALLRCPRQP